MIRRYFLKIFNQKMASQSSLGSIFIMLTAQMEKVQISGALYIEHDHGDIIIQAFTLFLA